MQWGQNIGHGNTFDSDSLCSLQRYLVSERTMLDGGAFFFFRFYVALELLMLRINTEALSNMQAEAFQIYHHCYVSGIVYFHLHHSASLIPGGDMGIFGI